MKKNLRFFLALWISKAAMLLQKLLGMNASHFPGKLAIKLCPDFLGRIDKPKTIITVTGTNGKTTCCNLILDVLTANGYGVLNNRAGSNIDAGVANALVADSNIFGKVKKEIGLFEVDERSSFKIYPYVHPDYAVCTNLFRDSIQRNAHPEFIFSIIDEALPDDTHMILNADDLISSRLKINNKRTYFSLARLDTDLEECVNIINDMRICPNCLHKLDYEYVRYHHIGKAKCSVCGFGSPEPDFVAVPEDGAVCITEPDGTEERYPVISSSVFNTYNETTAVTLLRTLGLEAEKIRTALENIEIVRSRYTCVEKKGIEVITNMTKGQNPVAASCVFDFVRHEPGNKEVVLMLDDMGFKRTSEIMTWIYDTDYEFLADDSITRIVVGGVRCLDNQLRLLLAGVPEEKIRIVENELDAPAELMLEGTDRIYILHDLTTPVLTVQVRDGILAEIDRREELK